MIFDVNGLDIAIAQISLNFLVSTSFLLRSRCNKRSSTKSQKNILKKITKKQSEEGFQTKITIQNQTSTIKKNISGQKSLKQNEIDNINTKKISVEHYPQSSGLLYSPNNKILENDKLMSDTNRQTHRSSLVPILQTQKQQTSSKSSTASQNIVQQNQKQQADQNKSIIKQLKENPSFVVSKPVQCQQCQADNSVEQQDDIITIERKRNMSIPNESNDDQNFQKKIDQEKKEEIKFKIKQKEIQQTQYIQLQNHFLLFSCVFFVQSIMQKANYRLQLYEEINLNNILKIQSLYACIGALYFNVFYAALITFLEKVLKSNQVITRLLFTAYNISIPFFVYSTIQEQNLNINLEFLLIIGCIYFIQFLVFIFCRITNWKNYPLALFLVF
ncbi:unnamed protein product [Paramecium sonneborni]|uniref:Transmembrane protein n=1 Tax=Paramecium sonneborni TaxID=65129 RepID=A0A8S1KXX0_9CILI|nr:unnamed protein product [Paramecium sonneborni]